MPVTDRADSPRAQRRAALRVKLMAAVEAELGAGATMGELGVEALVRAAGISRSSFYVYFEDRADLLQQWFESVVHEIVGATSGWWKLTGPVAKEDLHVVLSGIVRAYRPHARLMAAAFDAATHDPMLRPMTDGFIDGSIGELRRHIRGGQAEGWIDGGIDPAATSEQLTWLAERTMHRMLPGASDTAVRRMEASYTEIVFRTLYGPSA